MTESELETCRTPGQLIRALLEANGWSQRVLAIIVGMGETGVNKLVSDRQPVSAELALILGEVFRLPPERFLELQKSYDLAKARIAARPDPGRATRARLLGGLPVPEMISRGWLDVRDVRDVAKVEVELAKFFGVGSPDEIEILPHAAKKTNLVSETSPAQLAWLHRVKQIASGMLAPKYSKPAAHEAIGRLSALLSAAEEARKVPRILTEAGIRFVIVETIASAKIDGVCFWLDKSSPVIGMSLRFDRIDNFWFVLRHELEHVIQGHGLRSISIDADLEGNAETPHDLPEEERVANEAAARFCVPPDMMERFMARKAPLFSERDVIGFSRTLGIHPGLVAGQIHRRTGRYELFRAHLAKIRSIVTAGAMVDGWGDVAPVSQ